MRGGLKTVLKMAVIIISAIGATWLATLADELVLVGVNSGISVYFGFWKGLVIINTIFCTITLIVAAAISKLSLLKDGGWNQNWFAIKSGRIFEAVKGWVVEFFDLETFVNRLPRKVQELLEGKMIAITVIAVVFGPILTPIAYRHFFGWSNSKLARYSAATSPIFCTIWYFVYGGGFLAMSSLVNQIA